MPEDLIHKVQMQPQDNDLVEKKKNSSEKAQTFSVFSSIWVLGDRAILALRWLKFNAKVVKTPLCQHCKSVKLLLWDKSKTRTGTLGDTWDKRQPGEADHQHSSQGSSSVVQGYWRHCVGLKT